eukprot:6244481-Alexandrium_andersonii.AAC.1
MATHGNTRHEHQRNTTHHQNNTTHHGAVQITAHTACNKCTKARQHAHTHADTTTTTTSASPSEDVNPCGSAGSETVHFTSKRRSRHA